MAISCHLCSPSIVNLGTQRDDSAKMADLVEHLIQEKENSESSRWPGSGPHDLRTDIRLDLPRSGEQEILRVGARPRTWAKHSLCLTVC